MGASESSKGVMCQTLIAEPADNLYFPEAALFNQSSVGKRPTKYLDQLPGVMPERSAAVRRRNSPSWGSSCRTGSAERRSSRGANASDSQFIGEG